MRAVCCGSLVAYLLCFAGPLQADDPADARAAIDRALKAMGGEKKVAAFSAGTFKCKVTTDENGQQISIDGAGAWQGLNRIRLEGELNVNGDTGKILMVINGDDGWAKKGDREVRDAPQGVVPALKGAFYALQMPYLLPTLKDRAFTLASKGEEKVDSTDAVALTVSHKDRPEVSVCFDKKTGLPLKSQTRITEPDGKEVTLEFFYSDFHEVKGVKHPKKVVTKADGKEFVIELGEIQSKEKLDDAQFAKPE